MPPLAVEDYETGAPHRPEQQSSQISIRAEFGFESIGPGPVREVVDHKPLALNDSSVMFQRRTEVVSPMARAESIVFIKAAPVRVVWILHSIVPFPEGRSGIAGCFE